MSDPQHVVHYVAMSDERDDDRELMRRAAEGSREAVAQIARRYVGFVYAAALRQVRDAHLAEDVTQAVFVILAQKVGRIKPGAPLHAWLFTTTRYAAANATKLRNRRQFHERQAAAMRNQLREAGPVDASLEGMLDAALADLREADRCAVLLSYFGGKTYREVGAEIGTTEDAARKRVGRALAQMRAFFARRGTHVSASAVSAGLASAARASAPPGLAESVACCMSAPALSGAAAKGVISMMMWCKLKAAAAFAAGSLLTIGFAGAMVMHRAQDKPAAAATAPAAKGAGTVTLRDDVTVELLEVTGLHGAKSWNADGTPAQRVELDPDVRGAGAGVGAGPGHVIVGRVVAAEAADIDVRWSVKPSRTTTINHREHGEGRYAYISMEPADDQKAVDVRVEIAGGEWKTAAAREGTDGMTMTGAVAFGEVYEIDGRSVTSIADEMIDHQAQIIAIDVNGQEHPAHYKGSAIGKGFRQSNVEFALPAADVDRIELRTRPYDQWVEFKNVSLVPNRDAGLVVKSSGQ